MHLISDLLSVNLLNPIHFNFAAILGLIGVLFHLPSYYMKTIIPLRVAAIIGNCFLVAYGYLYPSYTTLLLCLLILPINVFRLCQMLGLIKQVKIASQGFHSLEWLKPFMTDRRYNKGDVLFHKGDVAEELLYVVNGSYRVTEIGVAIGAGQVLGELGFLAPDNRRTQTVECTSGGRMLTISYDKVREVCFQDNSQMGPSESDQGIQGDCVGAFMVSATLLPLHALGFAWR
jgi:Cyclic nucleotide-binding domain